MAKVHVLTLHGEIDLSRKQWIEEELAQIERFGPHSRTIIDLSDVPYLDTTFLNALCRIRAGLVSDGLERAICIVCPSSSHLARIFELTQLDRVFRLFDSLPLAYKYARRQLSDPVPAV